MTLRLPSRVAFTVLALAALTLPGCGQQLSRTLGITTPAPDEFKVTDHAPLTMPPSFDLPEPRPGARRPQADSPRQRAEQAIYTGAAAGGAAGQDLSQGERRLLAAAGGRDAPADIRQTLARENQTYYTDDSLLNFDNLVWWREPLPKGKVVDADAEAWRIRQNRALGRPLTEGETPSLDPPERAPLEGLF